MCSGEARYRRAGHSKYRAERPTAPAVAAVMDRRVLLLTPTAVSVRRSRAVSLRIRPADIASTPSAMARLRTR